MTEPSSSPGGQSVLLAGRYRLIALLGAGAMGSVYKAHDQLLDELVALKILLPGLCTQKDAVKRFIKEVSLTRKIAHSNVVRMYDVGTDDLQLFISMELIEGSTLKKCLETEAPDIDKTVEILGETCRGLHAIHEAGIIHRDLKPSNIMLSQDGYIKIADFGIARSTLSSLTSSEEILGTALYMAPEQWQGGEIAHTMDLYALGVIAYEMAAGIHPFKATAPMEYMYQHLHTSPVPPIEINPEVPGWLNTLILQLLAKDAHKRPASALDVILTLEQAISCRQSNLIFTDADPGYSRCLKTSTEQDLQIFEIDDEAAPQTICVPTQWSASAFNTLPLSESADFEFEEFSVADYLKATLHMAPRLLWKGAGVLSSCFLGYGLCKILAWMMPMLWPHGAAQQRLASLLFGVSLSLLPYSLLAALPVFCACWLAQTARRALNTWLILSTMGYIYVLLKLCSGVLMPYIKLGPSQMPDFIRTFNSELNAAAMLQYNTSLDSLFQLFTLSPLNFGFFDRNIISFQDFSYILFTALIVFSMLRSRQFAFSQSKNYLFLAGLLALLMGQGLLFYLDSSSPWRKLGSFGMPDLEWNFGSFTHRLPVSSISFAVLNWAYCLCWAVYAPYWKNQEEDRQDDDSD